MGAVKPTGASTDASTLFAPDVLSCPLCGCRLRVLATVQDPLVAQAILAHRGRECVDSSLGQILAASRSH